MGFCCCRLTDRQLSLVLGVAFASIFKPGDLDYVYFY